ncbi:hypothetical protein V6N13_002660 [Hibiscus sabdariffa]
MNFTTIRSSQSGSVFVEEILQSRFKGLSRGFQLTRGRLILKEFEIVNVFKGERIIGYWNPENGISSVLKEENHSRMNSTSPNKLENVIWPGGTMNVPKGWNLHDKRLRIGVPVNNGFRELISVIPDPQTNNTIVTGFCVDVFKEAIKSLDYEVHYEFFPFVDANGQMTGTYYNLILEVFHENFDAVVGDITIMASRFPYVDFTQPFTDLGIGIVVPKINKSSMWIFLHPLSGGMWITTTVFFVFTGFVVWLIERPINDEFQGSPSEQIGMILWYSFSTLVFAYKEKLMSYLSKFVVIIWVFAVLVITSSYTATLASMLTVQQIELNLKGEYVGYHSGSSISGAISNLNFENPGLKPYNSPEDYANALRRGSKNGGVSAIIDEMPYLKVFLAKYPIDYTVIKSKATSGGFGFVFPKASPLVQDISSAIVKLREEEKLQMMENKWFCSIESTITNYEPTSNPSRLNLHSFGGLFLVTGLSSTSALLVCLYQKRRAMTISNFKFYLSSLILLESVKLHAIIVAENSAGLKILAELRSRVKIPIIFLFAAGPALSFSKYPYLLQIDEDESSRAKASASLVESFGWRSVILISRQILSNVITSFEATGVRLALHIALSASSTDEEIVVQLKKLMNCGAHITGSRISTFLKRQTVWNDKSRVKYYTETIANINGNSINDSTLEKVQVHVGLIVDMQSWVGKVVDSCISMAVSDFYGRKSHHRTKLVLHTRDSEGDPLLVLSHALVLLESLKLDAIIVAENSAGLKILAELGSRVKIPIISLFTVAPSLPFSEYPYLLQIGEDDSSRAKAIAALVESFSWRSVILISEDNDSTRQILSNVITSFEAAGVRLALHIALSASSTDEEIIEQLNKLMNSQTSVYVVHTSPVLASRLFLNAKRLGMISQGYAWITTDVITNFINSMDPSIIESMQGVVGFKPHIPVSKEFRTFATRWRSKNLNEDQNLQEMELNVYGIWTYDMVQAVAIAAESVMARHPDIIRKETRLNMNFTTIRSSQSGLVFIEEILQSRFKGVSRGFQLIDGRLIPKEFEIVNVFEGERIMGYWNPENGITSVLKEENHTKMNSTSLNKLESVIWPGGTMNVPKGWNLHGKRLRIGVPLINGFNELIGVFLDPQTNETNVTGFCFDVFKEAIKSLNYEVLYDLFPFVDANGRKAGTYDDLIREVYYKNYDAVVGDTTIMARRFPYVDFTQPFTDFGIGIVVPKINKSSMWVFLQPLSGGMWITTTVSFVFTGFVVWLIEHPINDEFQGSPWEQVGMIFWYSFSTLVFAYKEKLLSNLSKFVVIIWVFAVLVITSSYTATLASMLTVQRIQLSSRQDYVGYQTWVPGDIISSIKIEKPRQMLYRSPEDYADALRKGSKNGGVSAIVDEIPYLKLFLAKYPADYAMIKSKTISGGFGFVFPKGSPLVHDISSAIVRLREEEKLQMMENKWFNHDDSIFTNQESASNPSRLNLDSFGGLFLVTGMSSTSALLVCLYLKHRAIAISSLKFYLNCTIGYAKMEFSEKVKI